MRCAYLVLPTVNNAGVDQTDTHAALQSVLIDTWGGFTMSIGSGGWRAPSNQIYLDPIAIYAVTMDDSAANDSKLDSAAKFYGHLAGQHCVMVIHASGEAAFLNLPQNVQSHVDIVV